MLISISFMFSTSCSTIENREESYFTPSPLSIDQGESASIVQLKAKVEINALGLVMLTENWNSKSKTSYEIIGKLSNEIRTLDGKVIIADVIFLKKNMYSGSLVVVAFKALEEETSMGE